jgi:hypothetical protein
MNGRDWLLPALLACAAAGLFHHIHNAQFIDHYPNMPGSLSAPMVYAAWIGATAIGFIGYFALRAGYRRLGVGLLALYGLYGLDALGHYALAPIGAHSTAMNASIWLEAATAAALLVLLGLRPRRN